MRCFAASLLLAWSVAAAACGQVVQLPTYRVFGTSTTVTVPDHGTTYLGGNARARLQARQSRVPVVGRLPGAGPLFQNRVYSAQHELASTRARVTVIDLQEMDRAVLAAAAQRQRSAVAANGSEDQEIILVDPDQLIALGRAAKSRGDYRLARAYFDMSAEISQQLIRQLHNRPPTGP